MDTSGDLFANGPQSTQLIRRLSDPGLPTLPSARLLQDNRTRRQSDPGRGHAIFTLRKIRDTLHPPMSEGSRFSYATSSATQSFVSMDTMDPTPTGSAAALDAPSEVPSIPSEAEDDIPPAPQPASPITPTRGNTVRASPTSYDAREVANSAQRQPTRSFPSPISTNDRTEVNAAPASRGQVPRRRDTLTNQRRSPGSPTAVNAAAPDSLEQDATVRAPQTREIAEDVVAAVFAPSSALEREAIAPVAVARQRSIKVSSTPTVVPPKRDETPRTSVQESRVPRTSTTSNRAPTVPAKSPPKSSSETPQRSPTTPTMVASTSEKEPAGEPKPSKRWSQRPSLPMTRSEMQQMDTKYVNMLLAVDSIPSLYNLLASFFTWILLAGFVLFPGSFTSLKSNTNPNGIVVAAVDVVEHVSLFVIAWVCTGIGAAGMCYLWYRWRSNYIWLVNKVFMPGLLNSLAGVISTLSSVLGSQSKTFSISSRSTIIVTSVLSGVCGGLTAFYMFVLIRALKKQHDAEVGKQRAGKHGEGFADLTKRKTDGAANFV